MPREHGSNQLEQKHKSTIKRHGHQARQLQTGAHLHGKTKPLHSKPLALASFWQCSNLAVSLSLGVSLTERNDWIAFLFLLRKYFFNYLHI